MTDADFQELGAVILRQVLVPDAIDIDIEGVAAAAHYVIAKAEPGKLGHVRLNKILWYADLEHQRWHGTSITGLRHYSRTLHGPMSQDIIRAVGCLVKAGKVEERTVTIADYARREMVSLVPPDVSAFTEAQIGILDQTIDVVGSLTATQLNRLTHDDRLWNQLENHQAMSVALASIMTPPLEPKQPPPAG